MSFTETQITNLKETIAKQQGDINRLNQQLRELRIELAEFENQYVLRIQPIQERIEAVQDAIKAFEDLIMERRYGYRTSPEAKWYDINEQLNQNGDTVDDESDEERITVATRTKVSNNLKQLYRRLARRFHPDLARNNQERERFTNLMAKINDAYARRDIDTLRMLDDAENDPDERDLSTEKLTLKYLYRQYAELEMEIQDLKAEYHDLMHGWMMDLKIQNSLARAQGRDLLKEMADDLQNDYWKLMQRLDDVRIEAESLS